MFKTCSKCGKFHKLGERCPEAKRTYGTTQERKMRSTSAWKKKSEEIREASNYLCAVCREKGILEYKNVEVHHIHKISHRPDLMLENFNLVALCESCHKKADAGLIPVDYLLSLAEKRESGTM